LLLPEVVAVDLGTVVVVVLEDLTARTIFLFQTLATRLLLARGESEPKEDLPLKPREETQALSRLL
jgi:hypothetical protein